MRTIISEKFKRVTKNRIKLEELLNVKINYRGKEITVHGSPENEELAIQMIDALDFGFPFTAVLSIKEEEKIFAKLNIKDYTSKKNLSEVRARIIGKAGKAIKSLSDLSGCNMELKDNEVGIIGDPENIEGATEAIAQIAQGAKHGHVYNLLEKSQPRPIHDLGFKEKD